MSKSPIWSKLSSLRPKRVRYFISPAQLVKFGEGTLDLASVAWEPEVCIILIPVAVTGTGEAAVDDPKTKGTKAIQLPTDKEVLVNGRCKIRLAKGDPMACAALCIGRDKG